MRVPAANRRMAALLRLGLTWSRTLAVTLDRLATAELDPLVRATSEVVKALVRTLPLIQPVTPVASSTCAQPWDQ